MWIFQSGRAISTRARARARAHTHARTQTHTEQQSLYEEHDLDEHEYFERILMSNLLTYSMVQSPS